MTESHEQLDDFEFNGYVMITSLVETFISDDYIQTAGGNIISRKAHIFRPQACDIPNGRIVLKDNVVIRGDLAPIQINKYSIIEENTVIRPSYGMVNKKFQFIPITIGQNTFIGKDSVIEASSVGVGCYIGNNVVLCKRCVLKDYVRIEDNTIVGPDTVIPPFAIVKGRPGIIVGELSESITTMASNEAVSRYNNLKAVPKTT